MAGPYDTEQDVFAEVQDVYAAHHKRGVMRAKLLDRLLDVCKENDVELGAYDRQVLCWLATQRPETAQVVAALIDRAAARA